MNKRNPFNRIGYNNNNGYNLIYSTAENNKETKKKTTTENEQSKPNNAKIETTWKMERTRERTWKGEEKQ